MIDSQKVKCLVQGCPLNGQLKPLEQLRDHQCSILCPFECGKFISKESKLKHFEICPNVVVKCSHPLCDEKFLRHTGSTHILEC